MLALLALLLLPGQQEQPPTFRAGVTTVLVDTLALDADGNPVPDMTADDFEIYEDGVRQTITSFDVTDWKSYVARRTSAGPGVPSPESSLNTYPRRFIFVFNRQGAEFDWLVRAKRDLNEFVVESMADGDEAMVIDVGYSMEVVQPFLSSKEDTIATIKDLSPMVTPYSISADRAAGFLYRYFEELGEELVEIPGRKVLVLLSRELPTFTVPGSRYSSESHTLQSAIESLNQANVTVYTVDLRGPHHSETLSSGLSPLATETGGRYFSRPVSFSTPLRRIGRENQRYYLLGYVPTNAEMDGSYRRIDVRTTRPDVELVARNGYFARPSSSAVAEGTETERAENELDREPPPAGSLDALPGAVEMTSYFLPTGTGSAKVPLSVALPRELLSTGDGDGGGERQLTVTITQNGQSLHRFQKNLTLTDYYFVENVELDPGAYLMQITLVSQGEELYRASTAIQVPAGFGERFGISSIVPVLGPDAVAGVGQDIPILPTTTMARGDDGFLLFQVFSGEERPSQEVSLAYSIYDGGEEVGSGGKDGPLTLNDGTAGGTPVLLRIPMSDLEPGAYRIEVRVEDPSLGRRAASEIELRIR